MLSLLGFFFQASRVTSKLGRMLYLSLSMFFLLFENILCEQNTRHLLDEYKGYIVYGIRLSSLMNLLVSVMLRFFFGFFYLTRLDFQVFCISSSTKYKLVIKCYVFLSKNLSSSVTVHSVFSFYTSNYLV